MEKAVQQKIVEYFSAQPEVALAYFFGSRARGDSGPMSDYDFAIYCADGVDVRRRAELRFIFIAAMGKIVKSDAIDVVILNDCYTPELKYQIITEGKLLFAHEPYQIIVEPKILNEYFDFKYLLRKYSLTRS